MSDTYSVQLWFCSLTHLDGSESHLNRMKLWLSEDEITKADRYKKQTAKTQATYVRYLLRKILSEYAAVLPSEWLFEYGEKGKPRLNAKQQSQTGINFNLSHSGDYLLIGVIVSKEAQLQIGVDIEHARENTDIYPILNHYFSPPEVTALLDEIPDLQRDRFFDLWALKESYIKATGEGLAKSLKSFGFDLSHGQRESLNLNEVILNKRLSISNLHKNLEVYSGLKPNFIHNDINSKAPYSPMNTNWQSCLGRLDINYRFAVTLGQKQVSDEVKAMTLSAKLIDPSDFLDPLSI